MIVEHHLFHLTVRMGGGARSLMGRLCNVLTTRLVNHCSAFDVISFRAFVRVTTCFYPWQRQTDSNPPSCLVWSFTSCVTQINSSGTLNLLSVIANIVGNGNNLRHSCSQLRPSTTYWWHQGVRALARHCLVILGCSLPLKQLCHHNISRHVWFHP